MVRAIGIAIYALGLAIHYEFGSNAIFAWCAFYMLVQNLGMALICLNDFIAKNIFIRIVSRAGLTYFSSAFVFYLVVLFGSKEIYFAQSWLAGNVLIWLLLIAVTLTIIDAYATRR